MKLAIHVGAPLSLLMQIPKKINPDRIKDAIVEIRYTSIIPYEVALGLFYNWLDESYEYRYRTLPSGGVPMSIPSQLSQEINLSLGVISIFTNNVIKFEIRKESIIFNFHRKYPGWNTYFQEIQKVISQISKAQIISTIDRIGLRYVSEYPNFTLRQVSKIDFSFGMPDIKSDIYSFRSEFDLDNFRTILNLSENVGYSKHQANETNTPFKVSSIDIDILHENAFPFHEGQLFDIIEKGHNCQKNVFFNVVSGEYLKTLEIEY